MPANTIGFTSSNPAMASAQGFSLSVMVSPTFTSAALLMPEMMYPTSPQPTSAVGTSFIRRMPISSAS